MFKAKWFFSGVLVLLINVEVFSQQLKLGKNPSVVEKSAVLELQSDNQGLLFPRLTDTLLINTMSVPDGMVIFHKPSLQLLLRSGGYWKPLTVSAALNNYWSLSGNSGANAAAQFLGTTDLRSFTIRTNNIQSLFLDSLGSIAAGSAPLFTAGTNREKFLVDAGTTSSFNVISGKGSIDNYLQLNIQNRSSGTSASSDLVATADNGTETVNFIDLGINSSGFTNATYPVLGGVNNAYLYSTGSDFIIGNATASKNLRFFTGGYATTNERMRIDGNGNMGIGITVPTATLHLKAGTASAGTAPLKFSTGPLLTTAEAGAIEFLTDKFYGTITTGAARKEFTLNESLLTTGRVPYATTNGRLTDNALMTFSGTRLSPNYLTLAGGTAASGTAPLVMTPGTNLTTPLAGAVEFDGTHFYGTVASTRYQLDQQAPNTTGSNTGDQTITLTGDVTGSGTGSFPATIGTNKVTYSKMQQVTTAKLLGNPTGALANASEISLGTGLSFVGSTLTYTPATSGTVSSVGLSLPSIFTVTNSPVTSSGTLTGTLNTQAANLIFAGPSSGVAATPGFRSLAAADLPLATTTAVGGISVGTGLAVTAGVLSTTSAAPSGAAGGDLTGTYPNPLLATVNTNTGAFGSTTVVPQITVNGKGLITAVSPQTIAFPVTSVNTATGAVSLGIANLNDATITTPATNQVLQYNGTKWVNTTPSYISSAITSLNGLTAATQTFATPGTSGTAPAWSSTGSVHTLNIPLASATSVTAGLLSNTDWNTFNNKLSTVDTTNISNFYIKSRSLLSAGTGIGYNNATGTISNSGVLSVNGNTGALTMDTTYISNFALKTRSLFAGTAPITYSNGQVGITQASGSTNGYLSSADWTTFNSKLGSVTAGNLTETGSGILTITGGTGAVLGSGTTVQVKQANGSQSGFLSSTDWTSFNSKQSALTLGNVTGADFGITGGTGAVVGSGLALNLATVNSNTGAFGSTTVVPQITVNGKGLITAVSPQTIAFPVTSVNTATGAVSLGIANLNDATITTPATNQVLQYNGTKWVNTTPSYISSAITSLNGLTAATQTFATPGTSGTAPAWSSTGSVHTLNIPLASATSVTAGLLSNTDWNTFNNKLSTVDTTNISNFYIKSRSLLSAGTGIGYNNATGTISNSGVLSVNGNTGALTMDTTYISNFALKTRSLFAGTAPITYSNGQVGITQASGSTNGYLSSADWTTFNSKLGSVTAGNLTETGSGILTITGGTGAVLGSGTTVQVKQANGSQSGFLSSTDWTSFNSKQSALTLGNVTGADFGITGGTGAVVGSGLALNLATVNSNTGAFGSTTVVPQITVNGKGLITAVSPQTIAFPVTSVNTATGAVSLGIANLNDATITTPATNQVLQYNGTKWVNTTPSYISSAITSLNGLTAATQTFATPGTSGTAPAWSSTGSVHTLNIPLASATSVTAGLLSNTDWNTFNNKLSTIDTTNISNFYLKVRSEHTAGAGISYNSSTGVIGNSGVLSVNGNTGALTMDTTYISNFALKTRSLFAGTAPITYSNGQVGITQASGSTNGYLSSADWTTFNSKLGSVTAGNLTETGSGILTITGGTGAVLGSGTTVQVKQANGSQSGFLSSTDWTSFNSKQSALTLGNVTGADFGITGGTGAVVGSGLALNLATVNTNTGAFGSTTVVPQITVNGKGLVTAVSPQTIAFPVTSVNTATGAVSLGIASLNDATITTPATNQVLQYNGTKWVNTTPSYISSAITSLNGLTAATQTFATPGTSGTAPAWSSTGSVHTLNIPLASATSVTAGLLSNTDWNTFNNKLSTVDTTNISNFYLKVRSEHTAGAGISYNSSTGVIGNSGVLSVNGNTGALTMDTTYISNFALKTRSLFAGTAPITYSNGQVGITQASGSTNGYLSSADWTTFNSKLGSVTAGNLTETGSGILTITGGTGAVLGSGTTVQVKQANGSQSGFLSSTDWTTFNSKQSALTLGNVTGADFGITGGTGAVVGSGLALNLATVNTNTGAFGSTTVVPQITVNGKGLITAVSPQTIAFPVTSVNTATGAVSLGIASLNDATITTPATNQVLQYNGTKWVNTTPSYISSAITSLNGLTAATQTFATPGTSGTAPAWSSTGSVHTLNIPLASATSVTAGLLSNTDWNTFNNKLSTVDTTNISNFYIKSRSLLSAGTGITYNAATGLISSSVSTANSWAYNGNTVGAIKNFGTIDNFALPFITNNTEKMRLTTAGFLGIGSTTPGNYLDVSGTVAATGVSGLRLNGLGAATAAAANSKVLSVNSTGDVIVTTNPAASLWSFTGNSGLNPPTNFLGMIDDKQMVLKSNNLSFLEFGRRQTLGLVQSYPDYSDPDEKVTYIRSALQFEAPAANFYKPKIYTDSSGNFRIKGSSAGTDYFEMGSTGTNNNGGFEFIIGDDGDEPMVFKSYNYLTGMSEIMRLQSGRMAVGSNAFDATNPEKLLIDAGVTNSYNLMTGKGSIDNYLQINVKNGSATANASSDLVASSDNGNESSNYIDMGINSSAYSNTSNPILNGANNAYLFATGNDLVFGNSTASKSLIFFTGGTALSNERMRIDGSGNLGLGIAAPTNKLSILGTNPLYLSGVQTGLNTDSLLTITGGVVRKILASSLSGSSSAWSITGNAGTSSATNFLGTTDAQDLVFKANSVERLRIVNGVSAVTGTTGDVTLGDANSGTVRSNKEMVMREDGDVYGPSALHLRNRAGENGAIFETLGSSASLVDFIFKTGTTASPIASNMRFETRSSNMKVSGNSTEWQFGQPDVVNGGPTLVIGAFGSGSNSALTIGNLGIGNTAPTEKLDITGNLKFSGALMPANTAGTSGYLLTSAGAGAAPTWSNPASLFSSNSWSLLGNSGTNSGTNFLGTTDLKSLVFRTNNTQSLLVDSLGNTAIGSAPIFSANPNREKFLVDAGTNALDNYINVVSGKGSTNNYLQVNIQNRSSGAAASSDVVATNNTGTESTNYIDMGINSSGFASGNITGAPNTAYLYATGNDFVIGNQSTGKPLRFYTTPAAGSADAMIIDSAGRIGMGIAAPVQKLDVSGNIRLSGNIIPTTNAAAGTFLQSNGNGTGATWLNPSVAINAISWGLSGNASTVPTTNFLGTTDNVGLSVRTANTQKIFVDSIGNVDIGTGATTFTAFPNREKLLVDAGTNATNSFINVISGRATTNNYIQLNIQNKSAGTIASSDVVATNDAGTESVNYIDMGINSSGNTSTGVLGGANNAYLFGTGTDMAIGNSGTGVLKLFTGTTEDMRIDASGNIGIGTSSPAQKLDVTGNANISGSIWVDGANANSGTTSPALLFGNNTTGESIASKRTTGGNQFGLDLYTNNTNRLAILQGGNVGIGTTTPSDKLTVAGSVSPSANTTYNLGNTTNRWNTVYATNGTISTSDRREKTNILGLKYGLKEVLALEPVSFNWKKTPGTDQQLGLIAQDVRKVVPEVVRGDESKETLGMNYAELIPVLINAIKEQQKQIDDLKQQILKLQK